MPEPIDRMVVKVQLSLPHTNPRTVLVYDETRQKVFYEGPAAQDIVQLMGRRLKAFFNGVRLEDGSLVLDAMLPQGEEPSW